MNFYTNSIKSTDIKGDANVMHKRKSPTRHIPPHENKAMVHIDFDEQDWALLVEIYGDEDTANAAVEIIKEAPPEIQILAIQLINIIEEVA